MLKKIRKMISIFNLRLTKSDGFTLMELLTSMAIISVLSTVVLVNIGEGNRRQALGRAAQQLALDIRKAQNLSLAPSDTPNCLYGLKINSPSDYFLYRDADCAPQERYVPSGASASVKVGGNIAFEDGIEMTGFVSFPTAPDIAFKSPEPITYLNADNTAGEMTITLITPQGVTKNVLINRLGKVEIQ